MAHFFPKARRIALGAVAALTLSGALAVSPAPAQAQWGYWGYRPAAYWGGGWGYPYRPYWHHRRHHHGAAVAAGLIGGLALGALAARPYYHPYPAYYARPVVYGGECWVERRVRINHWGERIVRRVRVCI